MGSPDFISVVLRCLGFFLVGLMVNIMTFLSLVKLNSLKCHFPRTKQILVLISLLIKVSRGNKSYCVRLFISVFTAYVQEKLIFFSFNHHVRGISSLEKI